MTGTPTSRGDELIVQAASSPDSPAAMNQPSTAQRALQSPDGPGVWSEHLPGAVSDATFAKRASEELVRSLHHISPVPSHAIRSEAEVIMSEIFRICQFLMKQGIYQDIDPGTDVGDMLPLGVYHLEVLLPDDFYDLLYSAPCCVNLCEFRNALEQHISMHPQVSEIFDVSPDGCLDAPSLAFRLGGFPVKLMLAHHGQGGALPPVLGAIPHNTAALYARRATEIVLNSVPEVTLFRDLLKFVRYWAKHQGVYGKNMGFFGGLAWAILCARVCQMHPHAQLSQLVIVFFRTLCTWDWRTPCGIVAEGDPEQLVNSDAPSSSRTLISVLLPGGRGMNATPYVCAKTSIATLMELRRGYDVTRRMYTTVGRISCARWIDAVSRTTFFDDFKHYLQISFMAKNAAVLYRWSAWAQPFINTFVRLFGSKPKTHLMLRPWPRALVFRDAEWPHAQALFAGVYLAATAQPDQELGRYDLRESMAQLVGSCQMWPEAENHKDGFELVIRHLRQYEVAHWLENRSRGLVANSGGANFSV